MVFSVKDQWLWGDQSLKAWNVPMVLSLKFLLHLRTASAEVMHYTGVEVGEHVLLSRPIFFPTSPRRNLICKAHVKSATADPKVFSYCMPYYIALEALAVS